MPVTRSGDDAWAFQCPDCEFASTGWKTKRLAVERGDQHVNEHETGEPMQEMADFTAEREV